jgi:hypothetical protein
LAAKKLLPLSTSERKLIHRKIKEVRQKALIDVNSLYSTLMGGKDVDDDSGNGSGGGSGGGGGGGVSMQCNACVALGRPLKVSFQPRLAHLNNNNNNMKNNNSDSDGDGVSTGVGGKQGGNSKKDWIGIYATGTPCAVGQSDGKWVYVADQNILVESQQNASSSDADADADGVNDGDNTVTIEIPKSRLPSTAGAYEVRFVRGGTYDVLQTLKLQINLV